MIENICLSGGADGADLQWGMTAGKAGHMVRHFSFRGHKSKAPDAEIAVLTPEQLVEADRHLEIANKTLKRRFPSQNEHVNNLLRRNYYQVNWAESVYAIATIERGLVTGGTAWAVQMFLDRFGGGPCAAYVYDQTVSKWFVWDGPQVGWSEIIEPPAPAGVWAGIGSRDLKQNGKDAIRALMSYESTSAVT